MSKISVIIPVYNAAKTVENTINSVLNQTFSDFELLVINDGSTDDTEKVVKSISDSRIRYFLKENGGPVSAYKLGIEKATSKYITFCDGDDTYNNEFLARAYSDIEKYDCDFCSYPYFIFDKTNNLIEEVKNTLPEGFYDVESFKKSIYQNIVFNSFVRDKMFITIMARVNKIYKKEMLEKILSELDEKCVQSEDIVFTVLCLLNSSSCYIDNSFFAYNYCLQTSSITQGYTNSIFEQYIYSINKIKMILEKYNYTGNSRQINYLAYDSARIVFRRCARNCDFSECKKLIEKIKSNELVSQVRFSELKMMKNKIYHILMELHFYKLAYFIFGSLRLRGGGKVEVRSKK